MPPLVELQGTADTRVALSSLQSSEPKKESETRRVMLERLGRTTCPHD